jgi:hypothetical protein
VSGKGSCPDFWDWEGGGANRKNNQAGLRVVWYTGVAMVPGHGWVVSGRGVRNDGEAR